VNSKIFWHFTGSPDNVDWRKIQSPKDALAVSKAKSSIQSFETLRKIIQSNTLKATCTEHLYGYRDTDIFCCVTDIAFAELSNHRSLYGDVAIGFQSYLIYQNFNPVLYIPRSHVIAHAIEIKESLDVIPKENLPYDPESTLSPEIKKNTDGTYSVPSTSMKYAENRDLDKYLLNHLKMTAFSDEPNMSFYQEKEWRRIGDFEFELDAIAAIVIPRSLNKEGRLLKEKYLETMSEMEIYNW
jgi:hypothetical protein